jgi:hypothetical protein
MARTINAREQKLAQTSSNQVFKAQAPEYDQWKNDIN